MNTKNTKNEELRILMIIIMPITCVQQQTSCYRNRAINIFSRQRRIITKHYISYPCCIIMDVSNCRCEVYMIWSCWTVPHPNRFSINHT